MIVISQYIYLSVWLDICIPICMYGWISVYLSICMVGYLYTYPLNVYLFVYKNVSCAIFVEVYVYVFVFTLYIFINTMHMGLVW